MMSFAKGLSWEGDPEVGVKRGFCKAWPESFEVNFVICKLVLAINLRLGGLVNNFLLFPWSCFFLVTHGLYFEL